ncbi:MAG: hypothetical protein Q7W55_06820 [Pseudohongiella sp.]|nr:hypothetical protein [Pseudohongiella sp.]MDO9520048.1 hypothetical protein [Pseudohongiella sp.]MDP2127953.1 hypothetical protein [Pseudohongiella sp.]
MEILTNKLRAAALGMTAAALLLGTGATLAQTAATIPAGLEGTYSLTFGSAQPGSPLTNGTAVSMVIAPGGTICIADYVLANPVTQSGNTAEAFWGVPSLGIKLALSNINTGSFNEVNVLSTSNQFYGQFSGSKTSNSTSCSLLGGAPQNITSITDIFRLAEQMYGDLFPPAAGNNAYQIIDGYIARQYTSTGTAIGIRNGTVYVLGGAFGDTPVTIGTIANTLAQLTGGPVVEEPVVDIPKGDYDLTISGTVVTSGISTPLSLTIESIPAPGSGDINDLEDQVRKAFKDVEGVNPDMFNNFQISEVSVSDSRVFFRAQFSSTMVTATPIGNITTNISYNLTYEYLKK